MYVEDARSSPRSPFPVAVEAVLLATRPHHATEAVGVYAVTPYFPHAPPTHHPRTTHALPPSLPPSQTPAAGAVPITALPPASASGLGDTPSLPQPGSSQGKCCVFLCWGMGWWGARSVCVDLCGCRAVCASAWPVLICVDLCCICVYLCVSVWM